MSDSVTIGEIPAGSLILRTAGFEDMAVNPSRAIFYETSDGSQHWLHWDGHTETVLKVIGQAPG